MGEIYHVTMLVTKEQEDVIKSVFKDKNWPCYLQVLSEDTVADIIQSGFTDVFPFHAESEDDSTRHSSFTEVKSKVANVETEAGSGSESSDTIEMDANTIEMGASNASEDKNIDLPAEDTQSKDEEVEMLDEHTPETDNTRRSKRSAARRTSNRQAAVSRNSVAKTDRALRRSRRNRNGAQSDGKGSQSVLQCIDCKLDFPSNEEFWQHRNEAKHPLPAENVPTKFNLDVYSMEEHKSMGFIKCDGCENYFLGKRRQMKHFYVVHRDLMPTPTCPICCKEFESHAELLKHKREEGHRDSVSSLNNYQCDICGKYMTSYSNFVQHKQFVCGIGEKEMEKIRIHACDLCGKLFKSPRHVRRHKKMAHFKVPEMCDVCGAVCQGRKALDVHKKRHDERNKKHVCSDCGKAFFSDSKLQEHIRTHTKEKPFKCPLCAYTCAVKPNIQKHATNVHKQMVAAVDLRKTQTAVENKTAPNTYVDKEFTRNEQGNCPAFSRNENVQNASVCHELNREIEENSQLSLEHEPIASTYIGNELNASIQGKGQIDVEHTPMSVPISYTDSDLSKGNSHVIAQHKTIPNAYIDNEMNRNIQVQCEESQVLYYPEQGRVDYLPYPSTNINLGQYQAHINP